MDAQKLGKTAVARVQADVDDAMRAVSCRAIACR